MDRIAGGVLAVVAFAAVLAIGLAKGVPAAAAALRAAGAGALGYAVGWLVFGRPGMGSAREEGSGKD